MKILFNNQNNKQYQHKLNDLLKEIFLDFQFWYDLNLWDENYESYAVEEEGKIISNINVFKSQIIFKGEKYPALSLGAVATRKEERGRGLARMLMEKIIKKYDDSPMYLSANDDVVDFYPKFGFQQVSEKLPVYIGNVDNSCSFNKLQYDDKKVLNYVYNRVNFSQKLDCLNAANINMFHLHVGYLKDCFYELPECKTLLIARQTGSTLKIFALFALQPITFSELAAHLPFAGVQRVEFGFMPDRLEVDYTMEEYKTDPLFVRGLDCSPGDFKFPELAFT
ncbi:MAG: GNAT family N-acetyltransferase [Bacillota bacterium]